MITLRDFVGAMLGEVSRARVTSDGASARIANQYLNDDLLRAFPVPRMTIKDIKFELSFAVAPVQTGELSLGDEEVQKNIGYRLQSLMEELVDQSAFSSYFKADQKIATNWRAGLGDLSRRVVQVISKQANAAPQLAAHISRVVENHFYESAPATLRSQLPEILSHPVHKAGEDKAATMSSIIAARVADIVQTAANLRPPSAADDPLSVSILVGAQELEGLPVERLQKISFSIDSSDRKWVTMDVNGKKSYILDRQ
jgi:hypothetical protein